RDDEAYYLPLAGSDADSMLDVLRPAFEAENIAKAGHNLKYIVQLLRKRNIVMKGDFFDNMLAHYLIEPEAAHDQHVLALQYLGYELIPDNQPDLKELLCERAGINLQLRQNLTIELESRRHVKLMSETEMPLLKVLADMEFEGVKVDTEVLEKLSEELRSETEIVQREIFEMAGTEFNIGSPKQLGEVLFEKMKLG